MLARLTAQRFAPWLRMMLGIVLSLLFFLVALREVSFPDVAAALAGARASYLCLAIVSVLLNLLAKTMRWRVLIGASGQEIAFSRLLSSLLVGQVLNALVPARAGDLSRAYAVGGLGPGRTYVLGTVVLEKAIDMIAYAVLFVLLLLLMPLPAWLDASLPLVIVAALVAVALLGGAVLAGDVFVRRVGQHLPARLAHSLVPRLQAGLASLQSVRSQGSLFEVLAWTLLAWSTAVLNNLLVLLSLNLHLPLAAALLLLIVLQAGITLPSTPGSLGVFEYLCIICLALYGVDRSTAFSYGVLLHGVVMLPPIPVGLGLIWHFHASRQAHGVVPPADEQTSY
jgi:glycosyltransferase 2 family protein